MLTAVFRRASVRARIESNPLGSVLQDYIAYLVARGHRPGPLHQYVFAVEHFGRWIRGRPIDRAAVERFIQQHLPRCRCTKKPCPRDPKNLRAALLRLLEMLEVSRNQTRDVGVIGSLLDDYEKHLRSTCGLAEVTVSYRRRYARGFLRGLRIRRARDPRRWSPLQVVGQVAALARRHKPSGGNVVASSIRSFLRFLLLRGIITKDLAAAVPSFANWRLASLPTTVDKDDLMRLVAAVDRSCGMGMRDRAVLLCMTELGLRAVEVASM